MDKIISLYGGHVRSNAAEGQVLQSMCLRCHKNFLVLDTVIEEVSVL